MQLGDVHPLERLPQVRDVWISTLLKRIPHISSTDMTRAWPLSQSCMPQLESVMSALKAVPNRSIVLHPEQEAPTLHRASPPTYTARGVYSISYRCATNLMSGLLPFSLRIP